MHFSEFNLTGNLIRGIEEAGYAQCTEVQQETLSHTLSGKDVFVQSQTGTGKTAAFLISLFELIERGEEREKALIVSPTRELAVQIAEEARLLSLYLDFNVATIYGGVSYSRQEKAIAEGIDILIGTPGRLIDMSNRRTLNLHQFNYAVIDEADRMFDMGFVHDIQTILRRLPSRTTRQTMLFSATLTSAVKHLAKGSMNDPVEVHIASENVTVDTINQTVYHVGSTEKMSLLLGVLRQFDASRTLIFVNMKHTAEEVAQRLSGNGFTAEFLTGDLAQRQRQRRIDLFKNNELPILVATDVAARGIHVDDLELVVNYDIPMHSENYVHRIGRTARAGKSGHAVTLACETFVEFLAPIEQFIKMKLPSAVAAEELYHKDETAGKNYRRSRRSSSSRPSGNRRKQRLNDRTHRKKDFGGRKSEKKGAGASGKQFAQKEKSVRGGDTGRKKRRSDRQQATSQTTPGKPAERRRRTAPPPKKGLLSKVISFFR
jgi:ATP-dependent RNA helicase RhlB